MPTAEPRSEDGRHQRSAASRDAIVDALLALVGEGHVTPGADLVAARAGVSNRTVFRHFTDLEALYADMADRLATEYDGWQAPFCGLGWRAQLEEMIARRTTTYERLMPYKRAADAHRHHSALIQDRHDRLLATMRRRLIDLLPLDLRDDIVRRETLDLLLSFDVWQRLRIEQRLDPDVALRVVHTAIDQVCRGADGVLTDM